MEPIDPGGTLTVVSLPVAPGGTLRVVSLPVEPGGMSISPPPELDTGADDFDAPRVGMTFEEHSECFHH
jgi:hypothetical protein